MTGKTTIVFLWSYFVLTLSTCDLDWAEFNGECFHFSNRALQWVDAARSCRNMGGYLLTDDNEEKHLFLTQVISVLHEFREQGFWIGADDYIFEGQWRWLETGSAIGPYTKWKAGSPSANKTKNCIVLNWEGDQLYWEDDICYNWHVGKQHGGSHYYICEKPAKAGDAPTVIG